MKCIARHLTCTARHLTCTAMRLRCIARSHVHRETSDVHTARHLTCTATCSKMHTLARRRPRDFIVLPKNRDDAIDGIRDMPGDRCGVTHDKRARETTLYAILKQNNVWGVRQLSSICAVTPAWLCFLRGFDGMTEIFSSAIASVRHQPSDPAHGRYRARSIRPDRRGGRFFQGIGSCRFDHQEW